MYSATQVAQQALDWIFKILGAALMMASFALAFSAIVPVWEIMRTADLSHGKLPQAIAGPLAQVIWAVILWIKGRFFCRKARVALLLDIAGRVMTGGGFVVIGITLANVAHVAVGLWNRTITDAMIEQVVHQIGFEVATYGLSAFILLKLGFTLVTKASVGQLRIV
jgi:hypothetical protein